MRVDDGAAPVCGDHVSSNPPIHSETKHMMGVTRNATSVRNGCPKSVRGQSVR